MTSPARHDVEGDHRPEDIGSAAILGATVKTDGTRSADAQGVVVYRADALVTRDVWERVQARLRTNR